jgi:hypothetical protein
LPSLIQFISSPPSSSISIAISSSITSANKIKSAPNYALYSYQQTITSASGNTSVTCAGKGGCLLLFSLNSGANQILSQNINITLNGLKNINYVTVMDPFAIKTFYDT